MLSGTKTAENYFKENDQKYSKFDTTINLQTQEVQQTTGKINIKTTQIIS